MKLQRLLYKRDFKMLKNKDFKAFDKFINKTLKKINKNIEKNPCYLGRLLLRVCSKNQITYENKNLYDVEYIFEFVDKETKKRYFYSFKAKYNCEKSLQEIENQLVSELNRIVVEKTQLWGNNPKKQAVDYRKVKIL
jgi:hypothetical protein